ncbi:MAG: GPW/gp25 family protein [Candidatus Thiodiazotropha taylori]|uniref:GPW/gp25 family protein n=1 Tax=Candidatus Thiodiazotropha taylori TaxID=2792791 RepID=A0A9E4N358_9GAMM|nr:GPW/gp25 family protein [Candidatus Thiodiazotropha taylori]MCW4254995.1 GPW/gp25 family protein [Candidatus Thiodiazotropha taylori]
MVQHTFQKKYLYKDFDISFNANPLTGDLGTKTDINAINQSLRSLIQTSYYERPFQPWVGSKIRKILFEPADYISMNDLKSSLEEVIGNYEQRVVITNLAVEDLSEMNAYKISITYQINTQTDPIYVDVVLKRLR